MTIKLTKISLSEWGAIITWLTVFIITLIDMDKASWEVKIGIYYIAPLFLIYFFCMIFVVNGTFGIQNPKLKLAVYILQLLSAFLINCYTPLNFTSILTVIWVSVLPNFVSSKLSFLITSLVVILWHFLDWILWQDSNIFFSGLLFYTFHLFSVSMTINTISADRAKERAEKLNKELESTQLLLGEVSRQNERTRIARDLHDLLGHHLTALLINLQIAEHTSDGKAKDSIVQCHSLAKLLMSDVREAVASIREYQSLNFESMLNRMIKAVPKLDFDIDLQYGFELDDIAIVKQLLSCIQEAITNCLKHSKASQLKLTVSEKNDLLIINISDNGKCDKNVIKGHGLIGIDERIKSLNGTTFYSVKSGFFNINIKIPMEPK